MTRLTDERLAEIREEAERDGVFTADDGDLAFTVAGWSDVRLLLREVDGGRAQTLALREAAIELVRSHYDDDYSPEHDWNKRHDENKAWLALESILGIDTSLDPEEIAAACRAALAASPEPPSDGVRLTAAEAEQARRFLLYATHEGDCGYWPLAKPGKCDCGLEDALRLLAGPSEQKGETAT